MIKKSVIDINAGLGGRAFAFLKAGYEIKALIEDDKENCDILKCVFGNAKIIEDKLADIDISQLPDAEVISAKYIQQSYSTAGKKHDRIE